MESRFKAILKKVAAESNEVDSIWIQFTPAEADILNSLLFEVHNYYADHLPEDTKYNRFFDTMGSLYNKVNDSLTAM